MDHHFGRAHLGPPVRAWGRNTRDRSSDITSQGLLKHTGGVVGEFGIKSSRALWFWYQCPTQLFVERGPKQRFA
jgi:hypothetical protein